MGKFAKEGTFHIGRIVIGWKVRGDGSEKRLEQGNTRGEHNYFLYVSDTLTERARKRARYKVIQRER